MYKKIKKFVLPFLTLAIFLFALNNSASAARFFLAPATSELYANCESVINIMIDTQGQNSMASDAIIDFNPAEVEIIDQNLSMPGTQIRTGTVYEFYPGNKVEGGRIYLTGASIMSPYRTSGDADIYGSIVLRNRPGVTNASLNFYYIPGSTIDSNISDVTGTVDLLNSVSGGSYTFINRGYCGNDVRAPVVSNPRPIPNSQGNPLNSKIVFDITDNLSGVNLDTVRVNVDGVDYSLGSPAFSYTGDRMKYTITVDTPSDFFAETHVVVTVYAQDNAGNVMNPYRYSFNQPIEDTVPPYVVNPLPSAGATGIALDSSVSFFLKDDLSGVDVSSIRVLINGDEYRQGSSAMSIVGPVSEYFVVIQPIREFLPNTKVDVSIDARDLKGNVMNTYSYSFNHPVSDNQPPYVQNKNPAKDSRLVPLDTNVSFNILDNLSGVDTASIKVTIDGVSYLESDFEELSGSKNNYFVNILPVSSFEEGKEIVIRIEAKDIFGNEMRPLIYSFNSPAVCGDGIVEVEFGEQCEPPNSPGCDENCMFEFCSIPDEPFCGNFIVEEGEECEPPGQGYCGSNCMWVDVFVDDDVEEDFDAIESFNLYAGFLGVGSETQQILREMLKDSDGDGLPDYIELMIGTNPYSWDTDGDGVGDLEELLDYGTDPTVFNPEFSTNLRIVHPTDGTSFASGKLFVRGISEKERDVSVFARSLTGQEFNLGSVLSSDNDRFALNSDFLLQAGEYLIFAESYNEDGSVYQTSDSVEIVVDYSMEVPSPRIRFINDIPVREGEIPRVEDTQPMVAGVADPGAQIIAVFQSSIFSSTIISDASSGFFTVFAPRPLDLGMHKITVYAISADGIISEATIVNFEVVEAVSVFEKFPLWLLIVLIIVLMSLIGVGVYLWYRHKRKKEESEYMKKLVEPVFEQKAQEEIKKELGK